jgi:hypothetical protein
LPSTVGERSWSNRKSFSIDYSDAWFGQNKKIKDCYQRVALAENTTIIVLLNVTRQQLDVFASLVRNCVIMPYEKSSQLHVYGLGWLHALLPWYANAHQREFNGMRKDLPSGIMYAVDGKLRQVLDMCSSCPSKLSMAMGMCWPLHSSCTRVDFPPLSRDFLDENAVEWFAAHRLDIDALSGFSVPHKDVKELSNARAFERICFDNLTANEETLKQNKERRSENAALAAITKRVRTNMCAFCTKGRSKKVSKYCSQNVEYRCKGPHLEEDYEYEYVRKCRIWMLHALSMTCILDFDARKLVNRWSRSTTKNYRILGPGSKDMTVAVAKVGSSLIEHADISYAGLCLALGIDPAESYEEAAALIHRETVNGLGLKPEPSYKEAALAVYLKNKKYNGEFVVPDFMLAVARCMSENAYARIFTPEGASASRLLVSVDVFHNNVRLVYEHRSCCRETITVGSVRDLYEIPGGHLEKYSVPKLSPSRELESGMQRNLVTHGANVTQSEWRELYAEHGEAWKVELPSVEAVNKLVRAKRRKQKKTT